MKMLIIEIVVLCFLMFFTIYLGTGSDEKNIHGFSSYPTEVQNVVMMNPKLCSRVKKKTNLEILIYNFIIFGIIFLACGYGAEKSGFFSNFIHILIVGEALNLFDFLIIDLIWFRHTKRVRFTGTEHMDEAYNKIYKHFVSFVKGAIMFLAIAIVDGFILSIIF